MLARFHFLTTGEHASPFPPLPGAPTSSGVKTSAGGRCLALDCETEAGFARGNYGAHPFTHVGIRLWTARVPPPGTLPAPPPAPASPPAGAGGAGDAAHRNILWDGRLLTRGRGRIPAGGVSDPVVLITTCQINEADAPRFLDQFHTARDYLLGRPGFLRHHLFEAARPTAAFRFVNVAAWRRMDDFIAAFSSPDFKALITGGFDHTSQIIVARAASDPGSIPT